jgi:hypothetical protein
VEREAVEFLLAGNVLDGLVGDAAEDCGIVGGLLRGRERAVRVGVEGRSGHAGNVEEQQERVSGGIGAEVVRRVKLLGGAGEGFAEGRRGGGQWSVPGNARSSITAISKAHLGHACTLIRQ